MSPPKHKVWTITVLKGDKAEPGKHDSTQCWIPVYHNNNKNNGKE